MIRIIFHRVIGHKNINPKNLRFQTDYINMIHKGQQHLLDELENKRKSKLCIKRNKRNNWILWNLTCLIMEIALMKNYGTHWGNTILKDTANFWTCHKENDRNKHGTKLMVKKTWPSFLRGWNCTKHNCTLWKL